jgi:hypothetical protein
MLGRMKLYVTTVLFFALVPTAFGQLPLPDNVVDTVTFLIVTDGTKVDAGTGFYVKYDEKEARGYLVTAKHVLMLDSTNYYPNVCMKINNNKGGTDFIPIELSGANAARVFVHPDDANVDIAIIPTDDIALPPGRTMEDYDITSIAGSAFVTKEHFAKRRIGVGDEAFLTGWFSSLYGTTRNYPIVRFGRLAIETDEKIPWIEKSGVQMISLYLVETHATKGNSGSPVFFRPSLQRDPRKLVFGDQPLFLAGVLKGYFGAVNEPNSGIAAVVPAFHLQEIMFSEAARIAPKRKAVRPKPEAIETCLKAEKQIRALLGQR